MTGPGESLFCECCGATVNRCKCEFAEFFVVDRIEGGEATEPGHYEEHCIIHDDPRRAVPPPECSVCRSRHGREIEHACE